jgi:hypothetical protein
LYQRIKSGLTSRVLKGRRVYKPSIKEDPATTSGRVLAVPAARLIARLANAAKSTHGTAVPSRRDFGRQRS